MSGFSQPKLWPLPQDISVDGLAQLKLREGCRLRSYRDSGGRWTIGYGRAYGVYADETITQAQADHFIAIDVLVSLNAIHRDVQTPLSQASVDALCSLIYNIGVAGFERSRVLTSINDGDLPRAATYMLSWCKVNGKDNAGLLRRRREEATQFAD